MNRTGFICLLMVLSAFGCKQSRPNLSGTITLDGVPIDKGVIQFIPDQANAVVVPTGAAISNGKFAIPADPGIPEGRYTVRISAPDTKNAPKLSLASGAAIPPPIKSPERIPAEWNKDSTHTIEIKKGKNVQDFSVSSK